jgi:TRAP-type C4-dicarboxylate transport system substrate-binding protein
MKMKKEILFVPIGIMLLVGLLVASSISAQAKEIKLSYAGWFPASAQHSVVTKDFLREIEKRTNGKVKITYHAGGSLAPPPGVYDALLKGVANMGTVLPAYTPGQFPLLTIAEYPHWWHLGMIGSKVVNEAVANFKPAELNNVKVLYLYATAPLGVGTLKPVNTLDDLKGLKVRSTGISAALMRALGATPVSMPRSQAYEAMRKGVVDSILSTGETLLGFREFEIVKAFQPWRFYCTIMFQAMSLNTWNSLPRKVQKTIEEVSKEYALVEAIAWDHSDVMGLDYAKEKGVVINPWTRAELAKVRAITDQVLKKYVADTKAKGLPAKEFLDEIQRLTDKYAPYKFPF